MGIKQKLLVFMVTIMVAGLLIITIIAYLTTTNALEHRILHHIASVGLLEKNNIEAVLEQNLERLRLVTSRTQMRINLQAYNQNPKPIYQANMNRIIQDVLNNISDFRVISILNLQGEVVASTRPDIIGLNKADYPFFERAQTDEVVDILFLDDAGTLHQYLTGPLYLEETLLGVLLIEAEMSRLANLNKDQLGLGKNSEVYLANLEPDGSALVLTPLKFTPNAALVTRLTDPKEPAIQAVALHNNNQPHDYTHDDYHVLDPNFLPDSRDYRGQAVLAVGYFITQTNWVLITKVDQVEANEPIREVRNILVSVVFIGAVVTGLLAYSLANRISQPIVKLAEVAGQISRGDLSARATVDSQDEVGQLATAFNHMTESLLDRNQMLDEKLQELAQAVAKQQQAETELKQLNTALEERIAAQTNVLTRHQQALIDTQQNTIRELSTPIIPLTDRVIVIPLVGNVDSRRAQDLMRAILQGISQHRAKIVILDITGVSVVDIDVANHLDKTIHAARLKGARTILTGISDAVTETVIDLGIDWSNLETVRDLKTGLKIALHSLEIK